MGKTFNEMLAAFSLRSRELWRNQGEANEQTRKQLAEQAAQIKQLTERVTTLEKAFDVCARRVNSIALAMADAVGELE